MWIGKNFCKSVKVLLRGKTVKRLSTRTQSSCIWCKWTSKHAAACDCHYHYIREASVRKFPKLGLLCDLQCIWTVLEYSLLPSLPCVFGDFSVKVSFHPWISCAQESRLFQEAQLATAKPSSQKQNHTMSGIGRDLTRSSSPIPLILEYICVVLIVDNYIYLSTTYLFFFFSFFNELSLTCILKSKFILLHFVKKCWRLKATFEWKHKKSVKEKFISF